MIKKHQTIILLFSTMGILLLISVFLSNSNKSDLMDLSSNPYVRQAPEKYSPVLNKFKDNDSDFFISVTEGYAIRELVIGKKTQSPDIVLTKFNSKVYVKNQSKPLNLELINKGVTYNFGDEEYVLFKVKLPLTDITKIVVEQKATNRKKTVWKDSISNPFRSITPFKNQQHNESKKQGVSPNPYQPILFKLLNDFNIDYIPTELILSENTLSSFFEPLKEYSHKNNITTLEVKNRSVFWRNLRVGKSVDKTIVINGEKSSQVKTKLENIKDGKSYLESVFDFKKLADYSAILNLLSWSCNDPLYFKLNISTDKLEPFHVKSSCLGEQQKYIRKPELEYNLFTDQKIISFNKIASIDLENALIPLIPKFQEKLALINSFYPEKIFDIDVLKTNQMVINKDLNPSTYAKVQLLKINSNEASFIIKNLNNYPIKVHGLGYKAKKNICNPVTDRVIQIGKTDTVNFLLPRSFENLFVSKKSKQIGFRLDKHIYDLFLDVSINGLDNLKQVPVLPYPDNQKAGIDIFRHTHDLSNYDNVAVDKAKKIVTFKSKQVSIDRALIIPEGYKLMVWPGTNIDIINNGKIISHGPVFFQGTKAQPISVNSSDKSGQGMLVMAQGLKSTLTYVSFNHLTNPKEGHWNVTGAITFYESPVTLNYTTISNNRCEDALNIIRTNFVMSNSKISHTQSDAFDGDFVEGTIQSSLFEKLGNDGIDVSGSDLIIRNVVVKDAGDKGLSAGEDSKMTVRNVEIYNSEIAVAGKDLSIVDVDELKIDQTKLGFTAFQKKPEFGPSNITVKGLTMINVEMDYLIENSSSLIVDGEKIETSQNVKDRMYGVEFGVSSAETRKSQ